MYMPVGLYKKRIVLWEHSNGLTEIDRGDAIAMAKSILSFYEEEKSDVPPTKIDRRFRRVKHHNNWGRWDTLGIHRLREGDEVLVKWDDGRGIHTIELDHDIHQVGLDQLGVDTTYIKVHKKGYPRRLRTTEAPVMRLMYDAKSCEVYGG